MKDYSKKANPHIEDTEEVFFDDVSDERYDEFDRILRETVRSRLQKLLEEPDYTERPPATKRHKIRMNCLFRERVGGSFLPFPEVDNFYERARSKIVIKLKINEFLDKPKARRREKRYR